MSKKTTNAPSSAVGASSSSEDPGKQYDLSKFTELLELLREADDNRVAEEISKYLMSLLEKEAGDYHALILYDEMDSISSYHSDRIYEAAAGTDKDILLIISSRGGAIEPAYLISKTCKRLAAKKFVVVVPRRAKSAATLICLGAHEIHMGLMSELGPIDPQIAGYPALGLGNSLNVVARLASKFPDSSDMFAEFLTRKLDLKDLGYFERVSESASQYAERLLSGKALPASWSAQSLANHFVNHYKDHGFVIDVDEAKDLLGQNVVKQDTPEYSAGNQIYKFLNQLNFWLKLFRKQEFDYVGSVSAGLALREHRNEKKND